MHSHTATAFALGVSLLVGGPVAAQERPPRVGLAEALRLFHENSPELALARSRSRESRGVATQARAFPNPSISATHESLSGTGPDPSETYLNLSQRIEWPGRRGARSRAAQSAADAAGARFLADSARLVFQVRRAYLEAAAASERLRVLEEVTAVFRDAATRADQRFAEGDVSRYARDRIGLERALYERRLVAARVELEAARASLGALILPDDGALPRTRGLPTELPPDPQPEAAYADAVGSHPTVAAARRRVEAGRAEADLARSLRLPDVTLTGGYKRQSNGFDGLFTGVSLPLPLLDRKRGAVTAAEARLAADRTRLGLARRSVDRELRRARARYRAVRAQAELAENRGGVEGAELLETARVAYREGEMDLVELLDGAEARWEAGLLDAQLRSDVWTSYYELIRASGGAVAAPASPRGDR